MTDYYVCVGDYMPELVAGKRYNTPTIPIMGGLEVYTRENVFKNISNTDTSYMVVSALPDTKIDVKDDKIYIDTYSFKYRRELNQEEILRMLDDGAIPTKSLVDWCEEKGETDLVLEKLTREKNCVTDYIFGRYMKLISFDKNDGIIKNLILLGYNIHVDDDSLLLFTAATKNNALCRFLLEHGANIPKQAYRMYSSNKDNFPSMYKLLNEYKHRVLE